MKNIATTAFIKDGGQKTIVLPEKMMVDLIQNIKFKGSEFVHLSGGKSYEVTGLLFTGKDFHKEERIILAGTGEKE